MPADFDPSIQTEDIGFRTDDLVACDACGRRNPPNRLECLYCGAALNVSPDAVDKFVLRKLEAWEPGTNIVITGGKGDESKAAELLSIDGEQLSAIFQTDIPLPIARVDDKVASVVEAKLGEIGFQTKQIPDSDIAPAKLPVRVSGMEIGDDGVTLIDFNTQQRIRHSWGDLVLLVTGGFSSGKIDSTEKRRLRGTKVMSETMTSADEPVFDLYTAESTTGYRVHLAGFDYSCLGDQMAPLATENITRLIDLIAKRAPQLKVVDDYKRVRHLLTGIWDIESRKDPKGLQQVGFGKREFGMVHSTNNVEQFTRFSRLQRVML